MHQRIPTTIFASLVLALLGACNSDVAPITGCTGKDGMQPICGLRNPEDMVLLPDSHTLLISQMGLSFVQADPGSLAFFDTRNQQLSIAFPTAAAETPVALLARDNWGSADCPGNPGESLAPHGIALRQRNDQRWQVAVVNHGGRETIEMFELLNDGHTPRLEWRGCVVPPLGTFVNDVALLKNGGLVASHMYDKNAPSLFGQSSAALKALLGFDTGYVFEWLPGGQLRILKDSHGAFLNGVEISPDDNTVFANVYFGDEIKKLDRASGQQLGSIKLSKADNLAWDQHGMLIAASHGGSMGELMACMDKPGSNCSLPFTLTRIDPQTMLGETLFSHSGAPLGAVTVAREVDGYLYLGSFSGDRIVKLKYR